MGSQHLNMRKKHRLFFERVGGEKKGKYQGKGRGGGKRRRTWSVRVKIPILRKEFSP